MQTFRLRVERPSQVSDDDVAEVIGNLGGSIVSVDLHEVEGDAVVDEVVVDLPGEIDQRTLRRALQESGTTALLSSKRCERDESLSGARRWAAGTERDSQRPLAELPQLVASACPHASVWVCGAEEADFVPAAQMSFEREAPVVHCSRDLPDQLDPAHSRSPRWVLAVPDAYEHPTNIALLSRPMTMRFTATEVARVQLLLAS